jgi:hypothetical protein
MYETLWMNFWTYYTANTLAGCALAQALYALCEASSPETKSEPDPALEFANIGKGRENLPKVPIFPEMPPVVRRSCRMQARKGKLAQCVVSR